MLSFREFISQAKKQLNTFSEEELRKIILDWGTEVVPSKRQEFLDKLQPKQDIVDSQYDEKTLLHYNRIGSLKGGLAHPR